MISFRQESLSKEANLTLTTCTNGITRFIYFFRLASFARAAEMTLLSGKLLFSWNGSIKSQQRPTVTYPHFWSLFIPENICFWTSRATNAICNRTFSIHQISGKLLFSWNGSTEGSIKSQQRTTYAHFWSFCIPENICFWTSRATNTISNQNIFDSPNT